MGAHPLLFDYIDDGRYRAGCVVENGTITEAFGELMISDRLQELAQILGEIPSDLGPAVILFPKGDE